jgi:pimeloyl-ACP methyl ester carboxylesterase
MMVSNNPVGAAAALRGRAARPDYRPRLEALVLPTFVCVGTADRFSTSEVTRELLDCLPHATTLILPDVGHLPNLEMPDVFNAGLVDFLRTALPAPRP